MKNDKGFTLLELTVVVAIIGILAAIAIPQFSKFQARSRQSEAKMHLSGIYSAEKSFHSLFDSYYGGLKTVGYGVDGAVASSTLRYNAGFSATGILPAGVAIAAGDNFDLVAGLNCANSGLAANCQFHPLYFPTMGVVGSSIPDNVTFTAAVAGNPNGRMTTGVDQWTINQNKQLVWTVNGVD